MSAKQILSSCAVFSDLEDEYLDKIVDIAEPITAENGEKIFSKGETATHLYIIDSASVRLSLPIAILMSEQEVDVDVKGPGQLIGWSALIPPHELTMSAYAVENCQLLRIDGSSLKKLCEEYDRMGCVIMSRLSSIIGNRLMQMDRMLAREIELNTPSM